MSSKNPEEQSEHGVESGLKSGFVCLAGPTNAGKSTLLNAIIGHKIAIATHKPQTTRNRILGIHTVPGRGQIVFVDTPGFHRPKHRLGERMNELARHTLQETDLALLVVDVSLDGKREEAKLSKANRYALDTVLEAGLPAVAALNKVDQVHPKPRLLPLIQAYADKLKTSDIVPVSALKGAGLDGLVDLLFERLPTGPSLYPEDILSDQAERFLAAEIIREKAILATHQELPYSVAVEVEQWTEEPPKGKGQGLLRLAAVIHVERDSQKGIVIGKGGSRLKAIGTLAREDLEQVFATKVFLEIFVRVEKDWTSNPRGLDKFGY